MSTCSSVSSLSSLSSGFMHMLWGHAPDTIYRRQLRTHYMSWVSQCCHYMWATLMSEPRKITSKPRALMPTTTVKRSRTRGFPQAFYWLVAVRIWVHYLLRHESNLKVSPVTVIGRRLSGGQTEVGDRCSQMLRANHGVTLFDRVAGTLFD